MNILLCFNDRFVPIARVLIISLMCHHRELHFYIGYTDLSEENRRGLKELVEGKCPQGSWPWDDGKHIKDDCTRSIEFVEFRPDESLNVAGRYPRDIWIRCFIWEQIPVDRLLYLDVDIVVNSNIEQFYHDDLGDNLLKACPDFANYCPRYRHFEWATKHFAELQQVHGFQNEFGQYCNSGVLLFNLEKMRLEGVSAKSLLEAYHKITAPLTLPDQDFINLFFSGRIKYANPYRYNCEVTTLDYLTPADLPDFANIDFSEQPCPSSEVNSADSSKTRITYSPSDIIVFHYNCTVKPDKAAYIHRFAEVFWYYKLMDPSDTSSHIWKRLFQRSWSALNRLLH